ncbi:DUF4340 domain-containing protein [Halopseudomonas nanhaiensis]|uniref:DUF4340 domain-containing protein n=1 Tax=Halopseudomonas nanhaiensis TaxID=2830842 RepID=UPI001CBCF0F9|nr:DUF4340 domain-containing protein [Halopseudomonas nanhaiensis]UAW97694.1 DUF4340 domain-containing protein [Halopseudomonas nanhaiensis]
MRNVIIALIAVVSIALVAVALKMRGEDRVADLESRPLFSDAQREVIDGLEQIELRRGGQQVELEYRDQQWGVANHYHYPAQRERVAALLHAIRGVRIVEEKTDNPEHHARLGLDPQAEGSSALEVILRNADRDLSLVYGNTVGSGQLVRLREDDQVWLINRPFSMSVNPQEWLALDVIGLPMERLSTARWEHADGEVVELDKAREGDYNFRLVGLAADAQAGKERLINGMVLALAQLRAQNVMPRSELTLGQPMLRMQLATFGGAELAASLHQIDGKYWLLVDEYKPSSDEVLAVNADDRWAYQLNIGQVENLEKRRADLVSQDD